MDNRNVSKQYLPFREKVVNYTNDDMNLKLENDNQVYIAIFDIPSESGIVGNETQTYALVFGLNAHIYLSSGYAFTNLEKNVNVMRAMQTLLVNAHQVLGKMQLVHSANYYYSKNIRAYLKTGQGIFFKELLGDCKEDRFLLMLLNNLRKEISRVM